MTFSIQRIPFDRTQVDEWATTSESLTNWPVVYVLDGERRSTKLYVGETTSAHKRMRQHLVNAAKKDLTNIRVVIDERYNKSVCLDLESHLIRWFHGDGRYELLNGNDGLTDARYYERDLYRESFHEIFEALRAEGLFSRSIPEIENSDLFKLSPFKALTDDQAIAVEDIVEGLLKDLQDPTQTSTLVVEGAPAQARPSSRSSS